MNWKRLVVFAFLALTAMPVASAQAYWRVGVGIGVPVYRPCYRVYVGPSLYVAPAPVYVQPVPVVVQPAPVVQPVYPAPAPQPVPAPGPAQPVPAPGPAQPASVTPQSSTLPLAPVPVQ